MRKISALILVFVLLASALCGCSKSPEEQAKEALQDAQKSEQSKLDTKIEKLESNAEKKVYNTGITSAGGSYEESFQTKKACSYSGTSS